MFSLVWLGFLHERLFSWTGKAIVSSRVYVLGRLGGVRSMTELISNILRGSVSSVMYVILLLTLTKSRFGRRSTISITIFVFAINMTSTLWFYMQGDLTGLSRFNILLFIVVGLIIKFFTKMSYMQWSFTFLTTINIAMMIIILSFHLGRLFPYPQYANTFFRFVLYLLVILLFKKHFLRTYRTVVSDWPIFSGLMICIFLNLSYFFFVTDDIMSTLATNKCPMLLLVALSLSAYGTVFFSLRRFLAMYDLENERYQYLRASPEPRRRCLLFRPKGRGISPCFPCTRSGEEPS